MVTTINLSKEKSLDAFEPDYVFFEPKALEYPLGKKIYKRFEKLGVPVSMTTSHRNAFRCPWLSN